jgi:alginate O-acetyltransferase complex protein AlgI
LNWKAFQTGVWFVILGYFHKSVIADNIHSVLQTHWQLGYYVENGSLLPVILAFLFGIEIYADFMGYSTIAIGLAYMFGFKLPINFNFPYIARSFSEF